MAYEVPGFSFTFPSAADYRTGNGQFRFVKVNSTGKAQQTVAGELAVGVRQNTPNTDEGTTVVLSGISIVEAGGPLTAGDLVTSDATGRAVEATTGNIINGQALEDATGAGILVAVFILHGGASA